MGEGARVRTREGVVDTSTGEVVDDVILDYGPEWRSYDSEEEAARSRAGGRVNIMFHDMGVGSDVDVAGVKGVDRLEAERLRRLNEMVRAAEKRRLQYVILKTIEYCSSMKMSRRECEEAVYIARRLAQYVNRYVGGYRVGLEDVPKAAVYYVGIARGYPFMKITIATGMSPADVNRYNAILRSVFGRVIRDYDMTVERYINDLVVALRLGEDVKLVALRMYLFAKRLTQGASARVVSASLVYAAAKFLDYEVSMDAVARAAMTRSASIRRLLKSVGLTVVYELPCIGETEVWRIGDDNLGIRTPTMLCTLKSLACDKPRPRDVSVGVEGRRLVVRVRVPCMSGQ